MASGHDASISQRLHLSSCCRHLFRLRVGWTRGTPTVPVRATARDRYSNRGGPSGHRGMGLLTCLMNSHLLVKSWKVVHHTHFSRLKKMNCRQRFFFSIARAHKIYHFIWIYISIFVTKDTYGSGQNTYLEWLFFMFPPRDEYFSKQYILPCSAKPDLLFTAIQCKQSMSKVPSPLVGRVANCKLWITQYAYFQFFFVVWNVQKKYMGCIPGLHAKFSKAQEHPQNERYKKHMIFWEVEKILAKKTYLYLVSKTFDTGPCPGSLCWTLWNYMF